MTTAVDLADVGRKYDESAPMSIVFNDGQVHLSYWYGERDDTPMVEASQRLTRKVVDALGLRAGEHLLDAGCGLGSPAIQIASEYGVRVTGVTVSRAEVAEATRRAESSDVADRVSFAFSDFTDLVLADGSVDAVMAIESLQCAADLSASLAELVRVLRPGGRITVAEYTAEAGLTPEEAQAFADSINVPRFRTQAEWLDALRAAGLAVEEYTQCGPRVFGQGPKYVEAVEQTREAIAAEFGAETVSGMKTAMADFFSPGAERVGYAIMTARKAY